MKVVLDTNLLVSAFLFGGTPLELVHLANSGVIELITSEEALSELRAVLSRRTFSGRFSVLGFSPSDVVERYRALATLAEPGVSPGICLDASDDRFIALAITADADVIASGDRHLLSCSDASPMPIVTAAELLVLVRELA